MVTRTPAAQPEQDFSDDGYAPHGVTNTTTTVLTRFSDALARSVSTVQTQPMHYRARAQGYVDAYFTEIPGKLVMQTMTAEQHIASYPSNVWLSQLDFGGDEELKQAFLLNCAFCHQQASPFMRNERTTQQWLSVIERMGTYGSRLPEDDHLAVAELLQKEYRELRENPERIPEPRQWEDHLSAIEMTEWPIGDGFSQMHDFLLHPNGFVYVGDNLFDRIYELDPETVRVHGVQGASRTGRWPGRHHGQPLQGFSQNVQLPWASTPSPIPARTAISLSRRPCSRPCWSSTSSSKEFIIHKMPEGFYPHTIRTDDQDRVWFTLALSSQVAMFDRSTEDFKMYDLPARGFMEWLTIKSLPLMFSIDPENRPLPSPDRESTGLPMPYGIDVAPDGMVWVARLYANDLARIDPETDEDHHDRLPLQRPATSACRRRWQSVDRGFPGLPAGQVRPRHR